jgi:NADPH-dependent 2,4-dienoyl-CoA reductase/sulfur reductase-like enzyme/rhodanese-related sulfurtransferase
VYNVIIIGGMAAGCKAAARLNRLCSNYHITIIEKKPFLSVSSCGLPFYAGGEIDDFLDLIKTSYGALRNEKYFQDVKGVNVLLNTLVIEINIKKKEIVCCNIKDETFTLPYDALIIATGSIPKEPSFPYQRSSAISFFHSPVDSKNFRDSVQKGEVNKAVIIGGGFIGCEMMEALTSLWGIDTVLIEKENSLLPGCLDPEISACIEQSINSSKIKLMLSASVYKIETDENGKPVIILGKDQKINADYVFFCLGVKPNAKLAVESGIKTGRHEGILVDDQMRTNRPDIWAAGDCVEIKNIVSDIPDYFSYGSLANRMGRIAADSIAGKSISFKGAAGTFSLKLFDNIIGAAGLTEEKAGKLGFKTASVIGSWPDRPDYYPEMKNLFGKLVYEKNSLRLLGIQLIGEGEVTRYIDVFSDLLSRQCTADDLINLEHGYTPAHSSPISPLNNLGYMIINQEYDGIRNFNPLLLSKFKGIFIDVREQYEIESSPFPENCIKIPLPGIRLKLDGWKLDQPIMFVCEKGPRSYEAARIFVNNGYRNISYLGGGNLFYSKISKSFYAGNFVHNLVFNPNEAEKSN